MDKSVSPRVLVVTPARNEVNNLPRLANSLKLQIFNPIHTWLIVNDGSTDGTDEFVTGLELPFPVMLTKREKKGKLITGAAFAAWWEGVDVGLASMGSADFVMKLDADVELEKDYFKCLFEKAELLNVGVIGGVISDIHREQKSYVPGPVKMYSIEALKVVRDLPIATGFDVMDEIICASRGLNNQVIPSARFVLQRQIGHSQGLLHGRFRNGLVCKWVGYAPEYFILHALRYLFRPPYLLGSLWMTAGYIFSNSGPYPSDLRLAHRTLQRNRLLRILKRPFSTFKELYL